MYNDYVVNSMKRSEVNRNQLTPMMLQYMEIKDQNEDSILFYRLGDFYEMFFEDAVTASHELELVLTGKNAGLEERIPMCGIPFHSSSNYIDKLIEKGYKVAICEQVEDPALAKGIVKREVINVVSKGTVMNGSTLDEKSNNYIGNILDFGHGYGVSYVDITTGQFKAMMLPKNNNKLVSDILSIGIKEVVVRDDFNKIVLDSLKQKHNVVVSIYNKQEELAEYKHLYEEIDDIRIKETIEHILTYLNDTQKRSLSHLEKVEMIHQNDYLRMDINTKRNLELTESLRLKSRNYSLLWLLDKTRTAMGSRMLKSMIDDPIIDIVELNRRYDLVETLLEEFILKEELRNLLYQVYDLERLVGRIAFGSANARDLLQLKKSLKVLPDVKKILNQISFNKDFNTLDHVHDLLEKSIHEDAPIGLKEGYLIKEGYHQELEELKDSRRGGKDFILMIEKEEKERTGIKNLKVGFNKVFGYYIEISKGNIGLVKEEFGYERKQTLANCERYITPLLKEKETLVLGAEEKIINLEYQLFVEIREEVKGYTKEIQKIAKILSEVDVLQSFATVTEENGYSRPQLVSERAIHILDSRHPVVEKVMDDAFVPNDIIMDEGIDILLITGPNMAGKSTYMRQLAIIIVMAQIGCFVPAKKASLPIFDKIFTRIGASDDLVSGSSTFMVEMSEAENALSNATKNSLILFDELGRGTATYDGMSLAQAILEYIHNHIGAKTLFSTHYHELTDLENKLEHLKNMHVSAYLENENLTFLHKVKEGSIDKSYGIHVAKLAHLPSSLIKRANEILLHYENGVKKDTYIQEKLEFSEPNPYEAIIDKLKAMDPLEMSPMEALNKLYEIRKEIDSTNE